MTFNRPDIRAGKAWRAAGFQGPRVAPCDGLVQIIPPFHPVCVEAALMERIHPQTLSLTLMCLDWETNAWELCVCCVFKHTAVRVGAVAEDDMRAGGCTSEDINTMQRFEKKYWNSPLTKVLVLSRPK